MLSEGSKAPAFTLHDQDDTKRSLTDYKGQWVLLYFYPKDDTPGCTKEACGIRDSFKDYKKAGIIVLGVSKDTVKKHKKFEEKYSLPFTLLADPEKEVLAKYEALAEKSMFGKKYIGTLRISYLINPKGKIVKVYEKVKPADHAEEVLSDVKDLSI